jgi:hypothetical protein
MNKLKASAFAAIVSLTSASVFADTPGLGFGAPTSGSGDIGGGIVKALCGLLKPFVGKSPIISLLLLIGLAAMVVLWFLNENKEGMMVWVLRSGIALGILINIVTVPGLLGLPSPCPDFSTTTAASDIQVNYMIAARKPATSVAG